MDKMQGGGKMRRNVQKWFELGKNCKNQEKVLKIGKSGQTMIKM